MEDEEGCHTDTVPVTVGSATVPEPTGLEDTVLLPKTETEAEAASEAVAEELGLAGAPLADTVEEMLPTSATELLTEALSTLDTERDMVPLTVPLLQRLAADDALTEPEMLPTVEAEIEPEGLGDTVGTFSM